MEDVTHTQIFLANIFSPPKLEEPYSVHFGDCIPKVHEGMIFTNQAIKSFLQVYS